MSRLVGRAIAAGVLGGMAGALFLAVFYGFNPALRIEFDRDVPRVVRGIHPPERDPTSGLTFAWTEREMTLRLPGLDRSVEWILHLRVRAARPDPAGNPELTFHADNALLMTRAAPSEFEQIQVTLPAQPGQRRGAVVSMRSSSTFVPGGDDTRRLGVQIDALSLEPEGIVLPPRRAFAGAVGAGAILGASIALVGVITTSAVGAALLVGAGAAAQIARGFGPHTTYPIAVATGALLVGLLLSAGSWLTERTRRQPLRNTARFALVFAACALFFKLLAVLHPNMVPADVDGVRSFHLFFTALAPLDLRGTTGLAVPWILLLTVEAVASLALYGAAVRRWNDRMAGAIAVALYHLIPLEFRAGATAGAIAVLGQTLSLLALALVVSSRVRLDGTVATLGLAALLTTAFVSATGTFAVLCLAVALAGLLFLARGSGALRSSGVAFLLAAAGASTVFIVLYYALGNRSVGHAVGWEPAIGSLGWPALLLAGYGAWGLWRRGARDRLTLALAGWTLSSLLWLVIGTLGGMNPRYDLVAAPAVALAGGFGASRLWASYGHWRGVAVVLMAWAIRVGTLSWWRAY